MALLAFAVSGACGPPRGGKSASTDKSTTILVATERASQGGRLVRVSSDGARQAALTKLPAGTTTLDRSPVYSADAQYLIFASNRGRDSLAETSLWLVEAEGGEPQRLTEGPAVDRDPRVSHDGGWLYFSSNREGSFDLYRARLNTSKASLSSPERITQVDAQVLSPSLSPDGSSLVYMAVNEAGESSIWRVPVDGSADPVPLSEGPMDMTPAWSADDTIAFSSRATNRNDADLFLMAADGSNRRVVVSAPNTDETGPRWSKDGRYLFAVGMYRSAHDGKPLLGSVVYVDLRDKEPILRALHDPSAVESRIGLALAPVSFDAALLGANPSYAEGLEKVLLQSAVRNERAARKSGTP